MSSLVNHLNGKTRFEKMGLGGVLIKEDVVSRTWIVHKLTTTQNEGYTNNTNKGYTIPRWNTKQ